MARDDNVLLPVLLLVVGVLVRHYHAFTCRMTYHRDGWMGEVYVTDASALVNYFSCR